jgi:hypothetical protein
LTLGEQIISKRNRLQWDLFAQPNKIKVITKITTLSLVDWTVRLPYNV